MKSQTFMSGRRGKNHEIFWLISHICLEIEMDDYQYRIETLEYLNTLEWNQTIFEFNSFSFHNFSFGFTLFFADIQVKVKIFSYLKAKIWSVSLLLRQNNWNIL